MARQPRAPQPHHAEATPESVQTFVDWVNEMRREYYARNLPNLTPNPIAADPDGRVNIKLVEVRNGVPSSVFCFIERASGAIMKAASFRAPEPKRYERGNVHLPDSWPKWIRWTGPEYLA